MHSILALTQAHDSVLETTSCSEKRRRTVIFADYWSHVIRLLRGKLSGKVLSAERDALWISSSLVSIISFASSEAAAPEQAWPLRPASAADLSWLKICDGEKLVWDLTNPLRPGGEFRCAALDLRRAMVYVQALASASPVHDAAAGLPPDVLGLFDFCPPAELSEGRNPYLSAVTALSELFRLDLDPSDFLPHLYFLSVLGPEFRALLRQKDERALLLLLYWYAKICDRRLWWMWKQSWTEGLAICEYLGKAWVGEPKLLELLASPRMMLKAASL